MLAPPSRHTGPPDAVLNDREQCSVAELLHDWICKIGDLRVHVFTHLGATASISAVTDGTVVVVVVRGRAPGVGIASKRVRRTLGLRRNRQTQQACRNAAFDGARFS